MAGRRSTGHSSSPRVSAAACTSTSASPACAWGVWIISTVRPSRPGASSRTAAMVAGIGLVVILGRPSLRAGKLLTGKILSGGHRPSGHERPRPPGRDPHRLGARATRPRRGGAWSRGPAVPGRPPRRRRPRRGARATRGPVRVGPPARLAHAGLVEPPPDPHDRRGTLVRLPGRGKARVDRALAGHLANKDRLLAAL